MHAMPMSLDAHVVMNSCTLRDIPDTIIGRHDCTSLLSIQTNAMIYEEKPVSLLSACTEVMYGCNTHLHIELKGGYTAHRDCLQVQM